MKYYHLLAATIASRILYYLVLIAATSLLPVFDASSFLIPNQPKWTRPLMRWDSLHFKAIADAGYLYENQWAFFPGTPLLLRSARFGTNSPFLWFFIHLIIASESTSTLHQLTRHHFPGQPNFADLVGLLSLLPSSPVTLYFAPYAEPFFTFLSYKGMLYSAKHSWLVATICFTLATMFRSNGILLSGYLLWGLVVQPLWNRRKVPLSRLMYSVLLAGCVMCPLIHHNLSAYKLFCLDSQSKSTPGWCFNVPPSIYMYVQAKYWNVGFLRYWELAQVPNFVVAMPPLALLASFSALDLGKMSTYHTHTSLGLDIRISTFTITERPLDKNLSIVPYHIHTLFMCATFLFFSHTQIVLRLAAALPSLYWGAAWLLLLDIKASKLYGTRTSRKLFGKVWIWWSILWGFVSLGLWVVFLPPA